MTDRVKALAGQIVEIVGALTGGAGPSGQGRPDTAAHFLLLFVEALLGGFFPGELQISHGGDEAEANGAAGRKPNILIPRVAR